VNSREQIFSDIRGALEPLTERTPPPAYSEADFIRKTSGEPASPIVQFQSEFEKVHGTVCHSLRDIGALLKAENVERICCDPTLAPHFQELGLPLDSAFDRTRPDACQAGITRGTGVIAESGTLILNDEQTFDRLTALAPWVHIAVVAPSAIFPTIPDAIAALGDDPNTIWCTGPSKTADVEGILIEGVHGPGIQVVYFSDL